MLASLSSERNELLENNARLQEYITILQNHNSTGNSPSELGFLRQQLKNLMESIANQRIDLNKAYQDIARMSGDQILHTTDDPSTSINQTISENISLKKELQIKNEENIQLLVERDRLLDLSNRLRASLSKSTVIPQISVQAIDSSVSSVPSNHMTVPMVRIVQLEDSLARVTAQNIQLHRDIQLLIENDRSRIIQNQNADKHNETSETAYSNTIDRASSNVDLNTSNEVILGTSMAIGRRHPREVSTSVPLQTSGRTKVKTNAKEVMEEGIVGLAKSKSRSVVVGTTKLRNYAEDLARENNK